MSAYCLKLLIDDLVSTIPGLVLHQSVELSPDNGRAPGAEPFDIRQPMDVRIVQDGKNPVVGSIDAIQIPFGSADSSIACAHNGQRATLGKRGCLQAKAEAPKILRRPMLPGVAGPMTHRIEQLVFRHPPAVVEDDHHRMLTGHIANDVDGVRASGNAVVDQIGNRSFERVPKVPHRFGKAGRARRMAAITSHRLPLASSCESSAW